MTTTQQPGAASALGRFLRARREEITPAEVGLTAGPGIRRTPGLRREELATLAGVSIDYYTRLERGKETRPSPQVVDALARALKLGETEHEHLRDLATSAARRSSDAPKAPNRTLPPGIAQILERLRPNPAYVMSRNMDVLAANPGGLRLLPGIEDWPANKQNVARYMFLHPDAKAFFADWENQVRGCVASLRALAGTEPDAPDLQALVGELLVKSQEFAKLWDRYEVRAHTTGRKSYHHPLIGDITLGYQGFELAGGNGLRMVVYYAEPGGDQEDALALLDMASPVEDAPAVEVQQ
ncbi:helix-turn-helix transcriptional regulator [Glycomyces luteolus]|uniref:Helix-turn-helix transcriptional regulator n=1 Tax=Glycomyces luteolus TaxID=2670330 RepID=A0A9X3T6M7_9ACTN|nr:helix-turn-helix transcriptional regulator [Glycomyces luteolus]MDA1362995.1 helix-turn-helix transcriptional regulator [Glycomyces luteolus]